MKGSIFFWKARKQWVISWSWAGKVYKIYKYRGVKMGGNNTPGIRDKKRDPYFAMAEKLLAQMQGDVENGVFRIEKYLGTGWTDVIPFFEKWLKEKKKKKPATYKGYVSYFNNWIKPFFQEHPVQLHEIRLDTLMDLLNVILAGLENKQTVPNVKTELILTVSKKNNELKSPGIVRFIEKHHGQTVSESWVRRIIKQQCEPLKKTPAMTTNIGKTASNIMSCFHGFMDYAWRSDRIPEIPPFPKKEDYQIKEPTIKWLPSDRQIAIIEAIPEEHQPIFWFLKYHLRRPSEACALHICDYDRFNRVFTIRRSISARQLVDSTKTGKEHVIPCHSNMIPLMDYLAQQAGDFMFQNPRARNAGKSYNIEALGRLWKKACMATGENIDMYSGLKHSSCSQYINEHGMALSDLRTITDHARLDSVEKYAKTEVARKRELMEAGNNKKTLAGLLRLVK